MTFIVRQSQGNSNATFQQNKRARGDESGATVVEYAVILTMIGAVIIFAVSLVGEESRGAYEKINTVLVENTETVIGDDSTDKCEGKDSPDDEDCGIGND